jgi:6-pyruvoyltetrahydropterin/6-carboxytetrahydropterin synthase
MELMAQKIRVTKKFTFDMAHALYGYDGPCRHIHGHTYHLSVTLLGQVISDPGNPRNGMVMDFTDLKSIVNRHVTSVYDHALVLNREALNEIHGLGSHKVIYSPTQPTCENLLLAIKDKLIDDLPAGVKLCCLKLEETPTSFAEWHLSDNPE